MIKQTTLPIFILFPLALLISCAGLKPNASNSIVAAPGNAQQPTPEKAALNVASTPASVVQINKDPGTLALAFYEYYLDGFPSVEDNRVIFAKYLTPRFLGVVLKADDFDPFLDAQDFDETWKDNFSVSDAKVTGDKATVDVALKGKTFKWVLRVSLLKKSGVWKIDGIKNVQN